MPRRRSSSAWLNDADAGVVGVQRLGVQPQHGQRGTQPVRQVGDQLPLVGAGGDQPVGHPVERVPGLGQLPRAGRLDAYAQVAVADRERRLDQVAGWSPPPGPRPGRPRSPRAPTRASADRRAAAASAPPAPSSSAASGTKTSTTAVRSPSTTGSSRTTPPSTVGDHRAPLGARRRPASAAVGPAGRLVRRRAPCTTGRGRRVVAAGRDRPLDHLRVGADRQRAGHQRAAPGGVGQRLLAGSARAGSCRAG